MLIEISNLKNLAVASLQEEAQIGTIDQVLLNPETGELIGFLVKTGGWLSPQKALSSRDVISYDHKGLVVRNQSALVAVAEIQPFKSILARKDFWLGKEVVSESDTKLGKVSDIVINTDLEHLAKIHVNSLFGKELILDKDKIIEVTKDAIHVKDISNANKIKATEQALA